MNERIVRHMDMLFDAAPRTRKTLELKQEMTQNANDKYQDLLADGYSEEDAYQNVIGSIGDVSELFEDLEERTLYTMSEADRKKKALVTSISVGLYIFAGVVFFLCQWLDEMPGGEYVEYGVILDKYYKLMFGKLENGQYTDEEKKAIEKYFDILYGGFDNKNEENEN